MGLKLQFPYSRGTRIMYNLQCEAIPMFHLSWRMNRSQSCPRGHTSRQGLDPVPVVRIVSTVPVFLFASLFLLTIFLGDIGKVQTIHTYAENTLKCLKEITDKSTNPVRHEYTDIISTSLKCRLSLWLPTCHPFHKVENAIHSIVLAVNDLTDKI